jgi:DNA-binding transcriptional LysR family regulator
VWALKKGFGVSAISRYVVADQLKSGALVVFPVPGWKVKAVVSALRVRDAILTPSAEQFQSLVRRRFADIARSRKQK